MDELSALLDQLTPEQLQQLLSLQTVGGEMEQAQALGGQQAPQGHRTMLGAIMGGVGAGGSNLASGLQQNKLRGQQRGGLEELLALLRQPPQAAPAPMMGDFPMPGAGYG